MGNNEGDRGLDSQSASLFCLACFERIANSVWVLKRFEPEYDAQCPFRWSAAMFEVLIAGRVDGFDRAAAAAELDESAPLADEYGYALASQVLGAHMCVIYAVDALGGDVADSLEGASNAVVDAIGAFQLYSWRSTHVPGDPPEASELTNRHRLLLRSD